MTNLNRAIPNWINKWLVINAGILIVDGSFCVLRPHSLPDGCLGSTIYYGYKWYILADKHYADPKDSFIFAQGFGNLIEASICLMIVFNVFKSVVLRKMVTMIVSVMTCYKTILFCIYSVEPGNGGRAYEGFVAEFLIFGLGCIWLFVPAFVVWVLLQDFIDIEQRRSFTSLSSAKGARNSYVSQRSPEGKRNTIPVSAKKEAISRRSVDASVIDNSFLSKPSTRRYNLRKQE